MTPQSNVAQHPSAQPLAKNFIAVASGKGGVGKTWFSISLSHALSLLGRKVLLFDGDLGLANVDIQLGLMPKHDVSAVVTGQSTVGNAVVRYEPGGFDIIAGQSGTGSLASLPASRLRLLQKGLTAIGPHYDAVILDLSAGVDTTVCGLASIAASGIVVTTNEPTAITDAYAFIKVMAARGQAKGIGIVVNLADSTADGRQTYGTLAKACESFLNISPPLLGVIRRDKHVPEVIRKQTALFTRYPTCTAAEDVHAVADAWVRG